MNLKKTLFSVLLASTAALTLASCNGGGGSSQLSIFLYQENIKYNADMIVYQKANEYAGVELKGVLQKYDSNYDTIYNLKGKNANVVVNDQDTIEATALTEGIFIDLAPYITEEYAPNLKKFFDENPEKKAWATASDGAIYGIPFYTAGETAKAFFVRQDWVNKLSDAKKLPSGVTKNNLNDLTVVQFEALLQAFKDNKNLLTEADNIYPYFDRDQDFAISELAGLWNATAEMYVEGGVVKYGATQESFKNALNNIRRWYKNGLIEPTILDKSSEDKRVTLFAQDSGGATHDWIGTTYSFNDDIYAPNLATDFELVCIAPPTREDGTKYESTVRKLIGKVTAINASTSEEDRIKLVKWIDYFFSTEGHNTLNYGVEGVHWNKNGNTIQYTDAIINDQNTALANLYNIGAQLQSAGVQTFAYEEAWLSDAAKAAMSLYEDSKNSNGTGYLNTTYNDLIYPNIKLTKEDYKAYNAARSAVEQTYKEWINDYLKGNKVIDSTWSQFVSAMNDAGVTVMVNTMQKYVD